MISNIQNLLDKAVADGVFPTAELLVAKNNKIIHHLTAGQLPNSHKYDLASLTKPLCTALVAMVLVQNNKLLLTNKVSAFFKTKNLEDTTVKQLLNHTSGLIDWFALYEEIFPLSLTLSLQGRGDFIVDKILNDDALYTNKQVICYSDLGYILLGAIIEKITDKKLDNLFYEFVSKPLQIKKDIFFIANENVSEGLPQFKGLAMTCLPSEFSKHRNRVLQGEVMDDNCFALGGVCGHAGLFGNAQAIHKILCELNKAKNNSSNLISQKTFNTFCLPAPKRDRSKRYFTLGFDTPALTNSQAGNHFSPNTIGHLGFTGTSFWWDLDKNIWVILLTNRTMPDRNNDKIKTFRPLLHDFIMKHEETTLRLTNIRSGHVDENTKDE